MDAALHLRRRDVDIRRVRAGDALGATTVLPDAVLSDLPETADFYLTVGSGLVSVVTNLDPASRGRVTAGSTWWLRQIRQGEV
jgi:hypothetical protein